MRYLDVNLRGTPTASLERLARWWTSASPAERFALVTRAINGEKGSPTLGEVHLAAFLAEVAAGEVGEG